MPRGLECGDYPCLRRKSHRPSSAAYLSLHASYPNPSWKEVVTMWLLCGGSAKIVWRFSIARRLEEG